MTLFVFEILCILFYGAASALGAFGLRRGHRRAAWAAKGVYLVAVAAHSAVIGMESVSTAGTLLSGPNIVMLASWVLAVVTAVGLLVTRRGLAFSTVAAPVVALLILVSQWLRILDPAGADNAMLIGFTHLVALYAAMAQIGTEGNLGYLVPRVALSLATTAVWSVFCALSFLAPWAASARTRDALAIAGLAAAVLLIAVSAG